MDRAGTVKEAAYQRVYTVEIIAVLYIIYMIANGLVVRRLFEPVCCCTNIGLTHPCVD